MDPTERREAESGREVVAAAYPVGAIVAYRPHMGHEPWYLGAVGGAPRLVGATWCVPLVRMQHGYRRPGVPAAAINAVTVLARPAPEAS